VGSSPDLVTPKTIKLVFVASLRSKNWLAQNQDNTSEWSDMSIQGKIIHLSGVTCLSRDCCYSELALYKNLTKCVGLVQSGSHHHHLIEN